MNIEKLAKHLKEFTLDEIEMIAECDVKTEIEQLLNDVKIIFECGIYKYKEKKNFDFDIFTAPQKMDKDMIFEEAIFEFLKSYAKPNCSKRTYETYVSIFKLNILPFFKGQKLNEIANNDIRDFYKFCEQRNLGNRRFRNTLVQLNQLIKYFQNQGIIGRKCIFQVKRPTHKTVFNINDVKF